jgi:hypothetical protein
VGRKLIRFAIGSEGYDLERLGIPAFHAWRTDRHAGYGDACDCRPFF